jgi:hypothetical protein
MLRDGELGGGF